jgi:hypothetical protein
MWWSPKSDAFQPPNEWNALGTGIGTFHADRAHLDVLGEGAGRVPVAGEYRDAV